MNKRHFLIGVFLCLLSAVSVCAREASSPSQASTLTDARADLKVPRLVRFSGAVRDLAGKPLAGPVEIHFAIYRDQTDATPLWEEIQSLQADEQGRYSVLLGSTQPDGLPLALFGTGEGRWLGVAVGRLPEQPRILFVSVPYALKAGDAESLGGKPASAFVLNEGGAAGLAAAVITSAGGTARKISTEPTAGAALTSGTTGRIAKFMNTTDLGNSVMYESSGKIGLGTASPAYDLDIYGTNAAMRLTGGGTHAFIVSGTASAGRLGQDANGFFFASDSNGKAIRFLTNNGALNEWMRITSAGNVGIGAAAPGHKLDVAGDINASADIHAGGNVSVTGTFTGNGSGLTDLAGPKVTGAVASATTAATANGLSCTGCVGNTQLGINYAASSTKGGAAITATNALALGGVAASGYATLGPNSFTGNQSITGNLDLSGPLNGLCIFPYKTSGSSISANFLGGFTGLLGGSCGTAAVTGAKSLAAAASGGNTITDGVIGGTIAGGGGVKEGNPWPNSVDNNWGTVGGGAYNRAGDGTGSASPQCCQVVAGGLDNKATLGGATVSGGWSNSAASYHATVPGGVGNTANGWFSFAAGCFADAATDGAFVWSGSKGAGTGNCTSLTSSAVGEFLVLAPGGVKFYTRPALTSGVSLAAGGGSWSTISDRNAKENFQAPNGGALLAQLQQIPILTWNYKSQDNSIRHIGPMAQDFYAAFGVGEDDQHITTVDADGVALAAIQALYKLSQEKDERIGQLTREVDDLRGRLAQIEKFMAMNK